MNKLFLLAGLLATIVLTVYAMTENEYRAEDYSAQQSIEDPGEIRDSQALAISAKAKIGCRAPDDPGCEACLSQNQASCVVKSWNGAGANTDIEPWYNAAAANSCTSNVRSCASCLERDEKDLLSLLSNPEFNSCDCTSIDIGVDPCFGPTSCACLCSRFEGLSSACPPEK